MDVEHMRIIAGVNLLYDAVHCGEPEFTILLVLRELTRLVESHFVHEEEIMLQTAYPYYRDHVDAHCQVLRTARVFLFLIDLCR